MALVRLNSFMPAKGVDSESIHVLSGAKVNQYDIQAIRKTRNIDKDEKFTYKPNFGSPQFGPKLVDWIASEHKKDRAFFIDARELFRILS